MYLGDSGRKIEPMVRMAPANTVTDSVILQPNQRFLQPRFIISASYSEKGY